MTNYDPSHQASPSALTDESADSDRFGYARELAAVELPADDARRIFIQEAIPDPVEVHALDPLRSSEIPQRYLASAASAAVEPVILTVHGTSPHDTAVFVDVEVIHSVTLPLGRYTLELASAPNCMHEERLIDGISSFALINRTSARDDETLVPFTSLGTSLDPLLPVNDPLGADPQVILGTVAFPWSAAVEYATRGTR